MSVSSLQAIDAKLRRDGYAHVPGIFDPSQYREIARSLGVIVGEESILLRPGAHAYVAKPGPVPLHTDQPQIEIISWLCIEQDERDGASLLLDARPVVDALPLAKRLFLRRVQLVCPPVAGGPPTLRFPVLRPAGEIDLVFCSPWLQSANPDEEHQAALDEFREMLSSAVKTSVIEVRLAKGDALFVDNQRILHGRRAIAENSQRCLHRLWVIRHETAALE